MDQSLPIASKTGQWEERIFPAHSDGLSGIWKAKLTSICNSRNQVLHRQSLGGGGKRELGHGFKDIDSITPVKLITRHA